jgi:hypothetical protein
MRVFNINENTFFLQTKGERLIPRKGVKCVYVGTHDEKVHNIPLDTANIDRMLESLTVVLNYERIPSHIASSILFSWELDCLKMIGYVLLHCLNIGRVCSSPS